MLPVDSNTIKRPLPLMPPAKDSEEELVTWPMTESIWPKAAVENAKIMTEIMIRRNVTEILQKCQ